MKSKKVHMARVAAGLAFLVLAGCASMGRKEDSAVIKDRAIERWNLLIAHKADKAWDFLSPGYRATKPRDKYADEMNSRGIHWSKVGYGSQTCEEDTCKVHLFVDYNVKLGGPAGMVKSSAPITETWVRVDGKWYYLPEAVQPKLGKEKES